MRYALVRCGLSPVGLVSVNFSKTLTMIRFRSRSWDSCPVGRKKKRVPCLSVVSIVRKFFSELCAAAVRKGVYGWFGEVHTPVIKPLDSGYYSYSWGYHHMDYLFAPTAEAFLEKAIKWAEEHEINDKRQDPVCT
jgi:hypothetical protein